jgi:putative ABC transport system substrate-binding protein
MNRRKFIAAAGGAIAAQFAAWVTHAQQPQKLRRIGHLFIGGPSHPGAQFARRLMAESLGRLGYEEGKNLLVERRYAEGRLDRFPGLAQELIDLNVELIVTVGNVATFAAKRATRTIPIVMMASAFPVEAGLIDSYARPGGNITGTDWWSHEIGEKLYQFLKDAVPGATRAARIWYPGDFDRYGDEHLQRIRAATGLTVVNASMTRTEHLAGALERVVASRAEVLHVSGNEFFTPYYAAIATFAAERSLVSISESPNYTNVGGLLHYCAEPVAIADRVANHIDRILRGAKPSDIPVERPTKFELVLNDRAAKAMVVKFPPAFTAQVTRVIG